VTRRTAVLGALAFALAGGLASSAQAQRPQVHTEITIILAKEAQGEFDEELREIPALQRAPFNSFRSMEILETSEYELEVAVRDDDGDDGTREITLPNGRRLRIRLQRRTPDGRWVVRIKINRPGHRDYLPLLQVRASPGDPFFVVGQHHDGGTLIVGIRLGEHHPARRGNR